MRASRTRERGAALVEFALLLPLLLMLLVGMVSVGLAYNHQISLTHAAREAGRYGATLPLASVGNDLDAWLLDVANRAVQEGTGSLDPDVPGRYVCVAMIDGSDTRRLEFIGTDTIGVADASDCYDDGVTVDHVRVQVVVQRDTDFSAVVFSSTISLDSQAVNRYEAAVGGA